MGKIWQFWKKQIELTIVCLFFGGALLLASHGHISSIPRSGIPFFATVFSTLLGLTFTAFSIIGAFMPNLETDFLDTTTFEVFEATFKITMVLELLSLIASIVDYLIFSSFLYIASFDVLILLTTLTLGFMGFLLSRTFRVFKIAKLQLTKET